MGTIENFFIQTGKEPKEQELEIYQIFRNPLERILTNRGSQALKNGTLKSWVTSDIREKFRNPPAHARFITIKVAQECKSYVLSKLSELVEYTESI